MKVQSVIITLREDTDYNIQVHYPQGVVTGAAPTILLAILVAQDSCRIIEQIQPKGTSNDLSGRQNGL